MIIKYHIEFKPTKVFVMPFKGNFMVFISKTPKPDKEKHDFMFSIQNFVIEYRHQIDQISEVFVNLFALTDLQAVLKIEIHKYEQEKNESKDLFKKRNSSLPTILPLKEEPIKSFDTSNSKKDVSLAPNSSRTSNNQPFIKISRKNEAKNLEYMVFFSFFF